MLSAVLYFMLSWEHGCVTSHIYVTWLIKVFSRHTRMLPSGNNLIAGNSGGGYHKPSALHSTDPIRVAKYSSECLFSESARTQPQKLMGQL